MEYIWLTLIKIKLPSKIVVQNAISQFNLNPFSSFGDKTRRGYKRTPHHASIFITCFSLCT